jgi:hypothetical protein
MKLILCKSCHDVVRLQSEPRLCKCHASGGCYLDDIRACDTFKKVKAPNILPN